MIFFPTISLVSILVFATLSSAVPVDGAALVPSGDVFARDVSELSLPVKRWASSSSVPDLYNSCKQNVNGIAGNIKTAVKSGNHGAIPGCLNQITTELNSLITGVRGCGSVRLDISIEEFSLMVYELIQIIVGILSIVVNINAEISSCISTIGGCITTLCQVTAQVVVGFNVGILGSLLTPLGGTLGILGFLDIFVNVGIKVY